MNQIIEKMKDILTIIKPYRNYILAVIVFLGISGILYFFTGEDFVNRHLAEQNSRPVSGEDYEPAAEFEVNAYADVNELIATYFGAYVEADFDTLEQVASPISDMEKSYIALMSQYYEEYQDVICYTKSGLSKDSYIVSVCFNIKFNGYDMTAPSMLLFYVKTDSEGGLYIDNLYSEFNLRYKECAINKDINIALCKYTIQEDYLELYNQVESDYNQLIKSDEEMYILTKRTIPAYRQEWEDNVFYAHETEESESAPEENTTVTEESETETETETESETESQVPTETEPEIVKVMVNNDDVCVRAGASTSSTKLSMVDRGVTFIKIGTEIGDDGKEWTKIEFQDGEGYIRSDLLDIVTEE